MISMGIERLAPPTRIVSIVSSVVLSSYFRDINSWQLEPPGNVQRGVGISESVEY
jgi:hypothetical protein